MLVRFSLFIIFFIHGITCSDAKYIAYRDRDVGSLSNDNPLSYYFNSAFDTVQNPNFFSQNNIYEKNHGRVLKRVTSPQHNIQKAGGYGEFFSQEFLGKRAVPNYTLHLIGGGYDFRRMSEWYQAHEVPYPYFWGTITTVAGQFSNEALESSNTHDIYATDHIADLIFFDTASKFLFANDQVAQFMVDELDMTVWNYRPVFFPKDRHIHNAGTNYILRPRKFSTNKTAPFIHMGLMPLVGFSYQMPEEVRLSFGLGPSFSDPLNNEGIWGGGAFLENQHDLMASIYLNGTENYRVRLNLYPGVMGIYNQYTNLFFGLEHNHDMSFGLDFNLPLGLMWKIKD